MNKRRLIVVAVIVIILACVLFGVASETKKDALGISSEHTGAEITDNTSLENAERSANSSVRAQDSEPECNVTVSGQVLISKKKIGCELQPGNLSDGLNFKLENNRKDSVRFILEAFAVNGIMVSADSCVQDVNPESTSVMSCEISTSILEKCGTNINDIQYIDVLFMVSDEDDSETIETTDRIKTSAYVSERDVSLEHISYTDIAIDVYLQIVDDGAISIAIYNKSDKIIYNINAVSNEILINGESYEYQEISGALIPKCVSYYTIDDLSDFMCENNINAITSVKIQLLYTFQGLYHPYCQTGMISAYKIVS